MIARFSPHNSHLSTVGPYTDCSCLDPDVIENTAVVLRTLEILLTTYNVSILPKEGNLPLFKVPAWVGCIVDTMCKPGNKASSHGSASSPGHAEKNDVFLLHTAWG